MEDSRHCPQRRYCLKLLWIEMAAGAALAVAAAGDAGGAGEEQLCAGHNKLLARGRFGEQQNAAASPESHNTSNPITP